MKKSYLLAILIVAVISLSGCGSNKDNIYGQDLVKYCAIYDTDSELSYEFPIICGTEIEEFSIEGYNITGYGNYVINYNGLTGGKDYNGWYYYFANVTVGVDCNAPAEFEIESVKMKINGNSLNYNVGKMYFTNIKGKYGDEYLTSAGAFVYEDGGPVHLVDKISDDFVYEVDLGIERNCIINEIGYMDFVGIDNIEVEVNGESIEFHNNLSLNEGDFVSFKYNLKYQDGVSKNDIVKTTFFVNYAFNDEKYAFIDEQGIIIVDMYDDNFIKNYIDEKIVDK